MLTERSPPFQQNLISQELIIYFLRTKATVCSIASSIANNLLRRNLLVSRPVVSQAMASSSSAPASSAPNFPTPLVPPGAPRMPTARLQPAFQPGMGRLPSTAHAGQTMPSLCRLSRAQHVPRAAVVDQVRENEWRRDALKRKRQEEADKSEAYWRAHPPAPAAEFSVSSLSLNALREPRIMIGTSDNQALAVSLDKIKHIRVLHVMLAQFEYPDLDHFATMEEMMDIIKAALESSPDKVLPRKVNGQQVLAPVPFPARVMNRVSIESPQLCCHFICTNITTSGL